MLTSVKRLILAGAVVGSLGGLGIGSDVANAMPIAAVQPPAASPLTAVRYYRHRFYRRYYRRHAGLYPCGPRQLHTHLQRKACR